jgi:hypothetical protein
MNRLLAAVCTALFLLLGTTLPLYAQSPPDTLSATANTAYQAKDWATAQPLYLRLTQSQPDNGRMWYRLGVCYQSLGKHKEALDAFQKAQATGVPLGIVGYTLVEQAKHNQAPCDYTAENRQFDFWVGDWDVVSTQASTPAGLSHIERTIGNCVIWENWTSIGNPGYTGKSYNIYNANFKRWEQFWVDSQGGMIHFYGNLDHSIMDFYTDEIPQPDGTKLKRHLQFFNLGPDKVRQFSQGSTDGGQTWSVEYDLTYNRKK